mgnify:CR=1 FL=1
MSRIGEATALVWVLGQIVEDGGIALEPLSTTIPPPVRWRSDSNAPVPVLARVPDRPVGPIASSRRVLTHLDSVVFDTRIVERVEVIEDDDVVAVADESLGEVTADKARAASDECSH